ncbi:MAG TPA: OmpA family protein [Burkholderiaceae bacterium]|nr:OmpA family protein [Burkholderiaceae bacterium]
MKFVAALGALSLLAGCASTREWYVVMPSQDGHAGSVVVTRDGADTVLEGAYSATASDVRGAYTADPKQVEQAFGAALQATPPRPVTYTLFFAANLDELTAESRATFESIAREIAQRPAPQLTIIGHADATLSHEYNDMLSLRRAQRIRGEMIRFGVAPERIVAQGRGKRELLVPTPDNQAEPRNRRVEVEVR